MSNDATTLARKAGARQGPRPTKAKPRFPNRREYLGVSEIAAALGLDPWTSPLALYDKKVGGADDGDDETPDRARGHGLEPIAAKLWEQQQRRRLRVFDDDITHKDYPFIRGHVDRLIVDSGEPWEGKAPRLPVFSRYKRDGLPQPLIIQLNGYAELLGADGGEWAIFSGEVWHLITFRITVDHDMIRRAFDMAGDWWEKHVVHKIPPSGNTRLVSDKGITFEQLPGEVTAVNTSEFQEAMTLLKEAKEFLAQGEELEQMAKEQVREAVGRKKGKYSGPGGRVYWGDQAGRKTFDHKHLARTLPLDRMLVQEALIASGLTGAKLTKLSEALTGCEIKMDDYFKQGEPFEMMRAYFDREKID